ncbi:MAG: AAA family ATPase [Chitinivibrionales bacterium]|nr:AAA family ATPase [Chitinivibrionales bacterium]
MTVVKRLALERFGRFAGVAFPLDRVTVFEGPNESGKTTLFDALFVGLCRYRRNTRYLDVARYGEFVKPGVALGPSAMTDSVPLYDEDEYRNLYAIRAGDVQLELDGKASWVSEVKRKLFAGGIDPEEIRSALEAYTSDDGRTTFNREHAKARAQRDALAATLKERQTRREEILQAEAGLRQTREELDAVATRKESLSRQLAERDAALECERGVRRRRALRDRLTELTAIDELESRRAELGAFAEDRRAELDALNGTLERDDRRLTELNTTLQVTARQRAGCAERIAGMQQEATELRKRSKAAESLLERVNEHRPAEKTVARWHIPLLVIAAVAALAGTVGALLLPGTALRVMAGVLGAAVAVALVFVAYRRTTEPDRDAEERFLASLRDRWAGATGDAGLLRRLETLDGIRSALQDQVRTCELHSDKLGSQEEESSRLSSVIAALESDVRQAQAAREIDARAAAEWLEGRGVRTRDEYVERLNSYRATARELSARRDRLSAAGIADLQLERRECERKLAELDRQGVPSDGMTDEQYQAAQQEVERLRAERDRLTRTETELTGRLSGTAGQLRGGLEPLMQEIVKLKGELAAAERVLADLRLGREGARLALRILAGIEADNELRFEELSRGIAALVGGALGGERQVVVSGLQTGGFSLTDAQGVQRPVDYVSSGTRDAFLFLARLELARRHGGETGLLVLDEPFLAFDDNRCGRMVQVLERFLNANPGWQIVLFTKEPELAGALETTCGARVHRLAP